MERKASGDTFRYAALRDSLSKPATVKHGTMNDDLRVNDDSSRFTIRAIPVSSQLRGYIELNTIFRIRANNDFEKNMFKLMNNAVFGKTNVRDRVRLVTR